jgi:ABC-type transport system substrate-binding protein
MSAQLQDAPQDSDRVAYILLRARWPDVRLTSRTVLGDPDMTAKFRTTRRAALAGCRPRARGGGAGAQTAKKGGTLTFLQNAEPTTLVSLTTVGTPSLSCSAKTTEGLLEYDYDIKPRPALATEWSISPDGTRYSFKLRPNVKFHDGKPFTSADVAYSIQLLKTVHPRGRNTYANVLEVQTPDPLTAVIVLSKPAPYLIKALTAAESPMMPRHIYEGSDPLTNQNGNAPIGTGPYLFKEWVRGSHVIYERNPNYWDPEPAAHRPHGLQVRARRRRAVGRVRERVGRHRLSHAGRAGRPRAAEEAAASRVQHRRHELLV